MSRIRVLLVAPSFTILGGQSVQASRLLRFIRATNEVDLDFQEIAPGKNLVKKIPVVRTFYCLFLYVALLLARAWRYDVLHVFSAAYSSYSLWTLPALAVAKLYGKKIILNYRDGQAEDHLKNWRSAIPTIKMMDLVVSPSGFLVDVFRQFQLECRSIYNVIDMSDFIYRKRSKLRPVFLHNRILEPLYNIPCALRAFKRVQEKYPDASLTIAHEGPSRGELEAFATEIGIRNYKFIGKVPHQEIAKLYDQADVYITTPNIDCMPGSLMECASSGLPIVATNAGGIPYVATNEETALIVPMDDDKAVAEACIRLLEDPALVERLTDTAFERCKRFSGPEVAKQWVAAYKEVLAGRTAEAAALSEQSSKP